MYKRRLDLEGQPIAEPVKHEIGEMDGNSTTEGDKEEGTDIYLYYQRLLKVLSFSGQ